MTNKTKFDFLKTFLGFTLVSFLFLCGLGLAEPVSQLIYVSNYQNVSTSYTCVNSSFLKTVILLNDSQNITLIDQCIQGCNVKSNQCIETETSPIEKAAKILLFGLGFLVFLVMGLEVTHSFASVFLFLSGIFGIILSAMLTVYAVNEMMSFAFSLLIYVSGTIIILGGLFFVIRVVNLFSVVIEKMKLKGRE